VVLRGPSPYHFVTVPADESAELQDGGGGDLRLGHDPGRGPDRVDRVDDVAVPQDGGSVVPLKDLVRDAEQIEVGDTVTVRLAVDV